MARTRRTLRSFARSEGGNVALLFALTLSPVVGAAGMALDYSRASNVKTELQSELDVAVLSIARYGVQVQTGPNAANQTSAARQALIDARAQQIVAHVQALVDERYADDNTVKNVTVSGTWADANKTEFRLTATGKVTNLLSRALPRVGAQQDVAVAANAKMDVLKQTQTKSPQMRFPGFEAGDYNRIFAYCYDHDKRNNSDRGRSKMTLISSNGESCTGNGNRRVCTPENNSINPTMPTCENNETLSFRLYNVRGARTNASQWPENASGEKYNYYSDTRLDDNGVASFQFNGNAFGFNAAINMMEMEVCDTEAQCTPGSPQSIIQTGRNRQAYITNKACAPGKWMYIGWEDRPVLPSQYNQWTDGDYDDIRLVFECPSVTYTYTSKIKLTK